MIENLKKLAPIYTASFLLGCSLANLTGSSKRVMAMAETSPPIINAIDVENIELEPIQALKVEPKPIEIESEKIEETKETKESKTITYSDEDLEVLTRVITGEAQCYSDEHQIAVGSVVLNRVESPKYPNTIKEVVFQRGQYACTKDGNYYREPTQKNREIAKYLLENGSQLPSNCIYQAQFKQGSGVYKKIGRTYICYE